MLYVEPAQQPGSRRDMDALARDYYEDTCKH